MTGPEGAVWGAALAVLMLSHVVYSKSITLYFRQQSLVFNLRCFGMRYLSIFNRDEAKAKQAACKDMGLA